MGAESIGSLSPLPVSMEEVEDSIASAEVASHLAAKVAQHSFLRPGKMSAGHKLSKLESKLEKEQRARSLREDECVGDDWFGPQDHEALGVRMRIVSGVEDRVRWLGSVAGSALATVGPRHSGESNRSRKRSMRSPVPVIVEGEALPMQDLAEGDESGGPLYTNLSMLGLRNSRNSSSSSLSSLDSSTRPDTPDQSIPSTPAPSLSFAPLSPFTSTLAPPFAPLSPRNSLSAAPFPSSSSLSSTNPINTYDPPSRTLTLDNVGLSKRESLKFSPARKLSIRPREFQRMLAQRRKKASSRLGTGEDDDVLARALMEIGAAVEETQRYVVEVLYENQRGAVVFGLPKFSPNLLNQFDPRAWLDSELKPSAFTPYNHPLPTSYWSWTHSEWLVDMNGDTDEQGWSYAYRFRSSHWRGQLEWRSFVRRRKWIRGRIYQPPSSLLATPAPTNGIDWQAIRLEAEKQEPGTPIVGLKQAVALLPLSRKDEVFHWERSVDQRDPFLSLSLVAIEGEPILAKRRREDSGSSSGSNRSQSVEELLSLWKNAVIAVNLERIAYLLKQCRLDREKLALWSYWLVGTEIPGSAALADREEEGGAVEQPGEVKFGRRHVDLWRLSTDDGATGGRESIGKRPSVDDVWDLLEAKLEPILSFFEFQKSRLELLHLLISLHPKPHSPALHTSFDSGVSVQSKVLLSPSMGSATPRDSITPRLSFYRDVVAMAEYYEGGGGRA